MKLNVITNRGAKKDFYDLFHLLKKYPLKILLGFYTKKYGKGTEYMVLKSLLYFEDAEAEPDPNLIKADTWEEVKTFIARCSEENSLIQIKTLLT